MSPSSIATACLQMASGNPIAFAPSCLCAHTAASLPHSWKGRPICGFSAHRPLPAALQAHKFQLREPTAIKSARELKQQMRDKRDNKVRLEPKALERLLFQVFEEKVGLGQCVYLACGTGIILLGGLPLCCCARLWRNA